MKQAILLFLISIQSFAFSNTFKCEDYDNCEKSKDFVKFESESTKLGIITTSFDGYAKDFSVKADHYSSFLKNIKVIVKANSFDTDNSSRDEKMFDETLETKKFEDVIITIDSPVRVFDSEADYQRVPSKIMIRGKTFPVILKAKVIKKENNIYVSGNCAISLKKLEIPDPSIAIANVRDQFDLSFAVRLK
ncbi:MAG: YceI family protein [Oligoflexia bacterium]|nr:YceI family protein [Oligoflexia bacterium]